jgi:hypothetical protein
VSKRQREKERGEYVCYRKRRSGVGRLCDWGRDWNKKIRGTNIRELKIFGVGNAGALFSQFFT